MLAGVVGGRPHSRDALQGLALGPVGNGFALQSVTFKKEGA